jgi:glycosyltransferase involved in cell wall biosynthesis
MSLLAPDVLYARLPGDFLWIMGLFARLRPGARFVYALAHDDHADPRTACGHRRWLHAPLYALGLHGAHAIAAQHESQAAALAPSLRSRAACVPNLVRSAAEAPRPWGDAEFDAAWIAQIRPEKRLDLFLDLAESLPRLRFAVVGGFDVTTDPAGRAALESRAAALPNVTMLGPLRADGVMGVLKRSRTLVNTSDSEGFPNTMLEAWSVGVPVLSLAVDPGGVIAREELGRVSRSGSRLWADLSELARDEALNRRLGSRAMAYVRRRHGFEEVVGALTGPLREGAVRSAPA